MIVVQHIEITWTKRSRGMPEAAARNAVPRALPLAPPPPLRARTSILVHKVDASEGSQFFPSHRTELIENALTYWAFTFVPLESHLQVDFTYDSRLHGEPNRGAYRRHLFTIGLYEVGVLHINGRFAIEDTHLYTQHFVNITTATSIKPALFTTGIPRFTVDKNAALF